MTHAKVDTILVIERHLAATPERVFDAITDFEAFKQWFGPGDCQVLSGEMNAVPGGAYHLRMDAGEKYGEVGIRGRFVECRRPDRIVMTWQWEDIEDADYPTTVSLVLSEVDGGTHLRLEHTGLNDIEARDEHGVGWNGSFDKLTKYVDD